MAWRGDPSAARRHIALWERWIRRSRASTAYRAPTKKLNLPTQDLREPTFLICSYTLTKHLKARDAGTRI